MLKNAKRLLSMPGLTAGLPSRRDRLDAPLVQIGDDVLTTRTMVENAAIFGGIGSGKTSGSAKLLATSMLRAGWGGLVLCAKPDEAERWVGYCRETGRSDSLIVIDDSLRYRFNFLEYELHSPTSGGHTYNIMQLFETIREIKERVEGRGGGSSDDNSFWQESAKRLMTHAVDVLVAATGTLRIADMEKFLTSLPREEAIWKDAKKHLPTNFALQAMEAAIHRPALVRNKADIDVALQYFRSKPITWDAKTWANIDATVSSLLGPYMTGFMRDFSCGDTTVVPDLAVNGAVIVMNLPVKRLYTLGALIQGTFKFLYQRAIEARNEADDPAPTFLFCDEAQSFYTTYDNEFVSTARSSRCANIYVTQNFEAYINAVGGAHAENTVDNFLSNFGLKIFHANTSIKTNKWASEIVGRGLHMRANVSTGENWSTGSNSSFGENVGSGENWSVGTSESQGRSGGGNRGGSTSYSDSIVPTGGSSSGGWSWGWNRSKSKNKGRGGNVSRGTNTSTGFSEGRGGNVSQGYSEQMDAILEPNIFVDCLRNGGPRHDGIVDAIALKIGGWADGNSYKIMSFKQ